MSTVRIAMTCLRATGIAALMAAFQAPATANDCNWSRQKFEQYSAVCAGYDGCKQRAFMAASVDKACGARTPPPDSDGDNDGQGGSGSTLGPSDPAAWGPPPPRENYQGESCAFFTRPRVESKGGVLRQNRYANGANVCYRGKLYECVNGRWSAPRNCPTGVDAARFQAERLEKSNFD